MLWGCFYVFVGSIFDFTANQKIYGSLLTFVEDTRLVNVSQRPGESQTAVKIEDRLRTPSLSDADADVMVPSYGDEEDRMVVS
jgi:hypothetical protein